MWEICFERGDHVGGRQPGRSGNQFHQRTHFSGRATFFIDDRVEHFGHVVDDGDTHAISSDALFGERWSSTVENVLTRVEAREQFEASDNDQDDGADDGDNQPGDKVDVASRWGS